MDGDLFTKSLDRRSEMSLKKLGRTFVNAPHNTKCKFNVLERLLARQHLPQDDAPTEHIAFLGVRRPFEYFRCHPSGAAFVVRHQRCLVGDRTEIAYLQHTTAVNQQQIRRLQIAMYQRFGTHCMQIGNTLGTLSGPTHSVGGCVIRFRIAMQHVVE